MAKAKKDRRTQANSSQKVSIISNRFWQLALFGGAALGVITYLRLRSRQRTNPEMPEPVPPMAKDSSNQIAHWSAKPPETELHLNEKEKMEQRTMPELTKIMTHTLYQRE